jgi:hypothetical protein
MKIKMLNTLAGPKGSLEQDKTYEVSADQAEALIKSRSAVAIESENGDGEGTDDFELEHVGGGYYLLSNGEKVKGKEAALEAENALQGSDQ